MDKKTECEKSLTNKFKVGILGNDPCPPVGKGTYKVANVCKKIPYVYYTKTSRVSKAEFKEAINDLYLPLSFPKHIQKYYMIPKCKVSGIPKKTDVETAVVDKLTPMIDAMRELGGKNVINMYLEFITRYLSDISIVNPNDLWQIISTDFKVDNMMISGKKIYITDFTPARANQDGTFDIITTPIFVLGNDFPGYDFLFKYSAYEISNIAYEICFLCILTSLYFMSQATIGLNKGYDNRKTEDYAFNALEKLAQSMKNKTLSTRIELMYNVLEKENIMGLKVWLKLNPFTKRKPAPKPKPVPKPKTPKPTSSDSPCHVFLKAMKSSSPTVINPVTGRKINKRDKDGNPTALIKKLVKECGGEEKVRKSKSNRPDSPCHVFLNAMKSSSPTVINPVTRRKINKRERNGNPTALIKKLVKECGGSI